MAVQRYQVYRCEKCGNIVEVMVAGGGQLVCCGQPMTLLEENTVDAAKEKHVPVVERTGNVINVKVGSVAHPMEEKHYIQWIEAIQGDVVKRVFLNPGQSPEATIEVGDGDVTVREYCNLHGLWKA